MVASLLVALVLFACGVVWAGWGTVLNMGPDPTVIGGIFMFGGMLLGLITGLDFLLTR